MNEHDPDSSAPEPIDELEPIDLGDLFDDDLDLDLDDEHDTGSDLDGADGETDDDAALMARVLAADLADEPASGLSTADIIAAARSAAGSAAGSDTARPGPPDRRATDELATRRRRRRFVSRGLLAAAAVAVLAGGTVVALNSGGSTDTASSAVGTMADAPAYAAPERTQAAAGGASSAASGSDSGSMLESSTASASARVPAAPSSSEGSSSSADSAGSETSASAASGGSTVTVTLSGSGSTPVTRTGIDTGTQSTDVGCSVSGLPAAAVAAAAAVLGGRPSGQGLVATAAVAVCQDRALTGQVLTTADGSRVTVLLFRDVGADGTEFLSRSSSASPQRSATVRSGQVRVQVSTLAGSSVTDRQLQQAAAAVLATQR